VLSSFNLEKFYQYLLIFLAFLLPLTVFGANLIIVSIVLLWLLSGNYKTKFNQIIKNKLMVSSIVFFAIHLLGLLWTEDLKWGLHILHKMWYFLLLLPVLFSIVKKEHINYYINSFLFAMILSVIISYLIWFQIIEPFKDANVFNPTPFMSHISYNPILAFATYLILHKVFFNRNLSKFQFILLFFIAVAMCCNMFITLGRTGQVGFFTVISVLIFQYFQYNKIKSLLIVLTIIPVIFFTAYQASPYFKLRVDNTMVAVGNFEQDNFTSLGIRLTYAINALEVIKTNPFIGVGTGDLPLELNKVNIQRTPNMPYTTNPHNMYVLVLVQLGLLGLISMLSILYYQVRLSFCAASQLLKDLGVTLPVLFAVLMLGDSYLLGHYTSLLFVFFSSFLYKDFEKN
jgi:O-antigen ligase